MDEKSLEKIRIDFRRDFGAARFAMIAGDDIYERPKTETAKRAVRFEDVVGDDIYKRPGM